MFNPSLVKQKEVGALALEMVSPPGNCIFDCFTTVLAVIEHAGTKFSKVEDVFQLNTITEINEVQHAEGSSDTVYFQGLVLQLVQKYAKHSQN